MAVLRMSCANAAEADPDGEIGEEHDPETHLIPLVLAAARNRTAVQIYGTDYDTYDGTCVRDLGYPRRDLHQVMDFAEAHFRAPDYLLANGESSCERPPSVPFRNSGAEFAHP
jgi:UDP-glucose 4-epimerase